jgi:hypothetical protein
VPSATASFASTSATRDMPQFLLSLPDFLYPRSPAVLRAAVVVRHRRPEPSPRLRRHREVPGVRLEVRNLLCPLPSPPSLPAALNSSSESVGAAAEPFRPGSPPPVPLSQPSPASKFPTPSPISQTTSVALRPAEPPRPCLRRAPPPRVRPPPPLLAGEGD